MSHKIPERPWEPVRADIFTINNRFYLYVVYYHSRVPIVKQIDAFSADNLITAIKIIFSEYGFPNKIFSDMGTNFISEKFESFCKRLGIQRAVSSSYNHQINGQAGTCIKFVKRTVNKNAMKLMLTY